MQVATQVTNMQIKLITGKNFSLQRLNSQKETWREFSQPLTSGNPQKQITISRISNIVNAIVQHMVANGCLATNSSRLDASSIWQSFGLSTKLLLSSYDVFVFSLYLYVLVQCVLCQILRNCTTNYTSYLKSYNREKTFQNE